jgi:RND family efflux transporter MFP subunit
MTARTHLFLAAALSLGVLIPACDKQDEGSGLPEPTGDQAPARAVIPTPAKAIAGETAYETNNHRWIGSVRAKHHVELAPGMTGIIASIAVEEGDAVKAGDKLFRIEGAEVKLAVSQAQAALAGAELQLAESERETERTRKLAERGSVGAANLERAEAGVKAADAGVKQAKAAVSMARARTADLTVDSPISGIVTAKYKNVGEVATMMPPTIVLVIDDLSVVEVRVRVPEMKLREVDVGTEVTVYFPALDIERRVPITRIGNSVDPHTRTIELILEVDNADLRIKSGMSVELALGSSVAAAAEAEANANTNADANAEPNADKPAKTPTAMVTKPG